GIGWPLFFAIDRWRQRERAAILRKHQIDKEQDHGYLFVNQYGRPIQPVTLNHIFNRMSERVGFRVTPHMLRHSFAVTKRRFDEAAGVRQSLRGVQLELGHRGLDTTEKYYDHLSSAEKALEDASNQTRYDLSRPRKKDEKKAKK
ncbi:MAG TPA: tyrosine-type recombinase/integrase, partial [Acidobacteriota bacterium]|nr:tyrosine-type recombinase/integrase [Acidobacteriota bacterium]